MQTEASAGLAAPAAGLHVRVAWLCAAVLMLEGYDIAAVGYAIPSLVDAWKLPPAAFTQVLTAANVGLMLGSLGAGLAGDRWGRKPVLLASVAAFGVFAFSTSFAHTIPALAIARFFTGLGLGGGIPITIALVADVAPPQTRGRLLILTSAAVPVGFTAGGLLASRLVTVFGWPAIFIAGGVLPLVVVPLLATSLPESLAPRSAQRPSSSAAALFQNGLASKTVLLWLINITNYVGLYFVLLWTPAILHSTGVSPARAILGTTIYAVGVLASPLLAAFIVGRLGIERVLAVCLAFGGLCAAAIGFVAPQFWVLALLLAGVGIGNGCQAGINSLSGLVYPPGIRSTGAGWAMGMGRIGTIGGPLFGGLLLALGVHPQTMFLIASIPAFAASMLMVMLGRRHV
jgi:AAHS family 4-hydroxybenzoate transporter-like MFS transporter